MKIQKVVRFYIVYDSAPCRRELLLNLKIQMMYDISPGVVVIYEPRVNTVGGGGIVLNRVSDISEDGWIGRYRLRKI